ncbi:CdaR family protein [Brassicibacter mesophilus]|uniref:CdaR family protein n=1 Tax=Brassicibacter mesophilus TaxID=745119 RepID=UPI003D1A0B6C
MSKGKYRNLTIKIVAIFIATVLWSYVMSEVNPLTTKEFTDVKVNLLNEDSLQQEGLVIMEPKEVKISVKVKGRRSDINTLSSSDIIAQADLWGYSEGSNKVPVEVKVPEKIDIESTTPKQILFKFDSIVTREKPVILKPIGAVEDGYSVGQGQVNPNTILIKGPRSWINSVSQVIASVDVTKLTSDIKTDVPLKVVDDKGKEVRGIEKEPNTVQVTLPMLPTKNVVIEPKTKGSPLNGYKITRIQTNPSNILIKGYEQNIKDISSIETEPIDIDFITSDKEVEVVLVLPEGVALVDSSTKPTATIKVEKIVEKELEYDLEKITFTNLNQQLTLDKSNSTEKFKVTVRGTESSIERLKQEDITLYADFLDLEEGTHIVDIQIAKPDNIDLVDVEPSSIHLTLKKEF